MRNINKIFLCSILALLMLPLSVSADGVSIEYNNQVKKEQYEKLHDEYNAILEQNKEIEEENARLEQEYQEALKKYEEDYEKYEEELKAYEDAIAKNEEIEIENAKLEQEYQNALKKYEEEYKQYQVELDEFNKAMEDMEASTGIDGNLSQAIPQNLQFNENPQAKVSISGGIPTDVVTEGGPITSRNGANRPNIGRILPRGGKVIATYTNLKNMSYAGKEISKMTNTYTMDNTNYQDEVYVFSYQDPTNGFYVENIEGKNGRTSVKVSTQFYDENGKLINFEQDKPAVIAFSSLNNNTNPNINTKWIETVRNFNGNFVKITGSLVDIDSNGVIKANTYTNDNPNLPVDIDRVDSPYFYLMSGGAYVNSGNSISYVVDCYGIEHEGQPVVDGSWGGGQWTSYNSKVPWAIMPVQPVEPKAPKPPVYTELVPVSAEPPVPPTKPEPPVLKDLLALPQKPVEPEYESYVKPEKPVVKTGVKNISIALLGVIAISSGIILYRRNRK